MEGLSLGADIFGGRRPATLQHDPFRKLAIIFSLVLANLTMRFLMQCIEPAHERGDEIFEWPAAGSVEEKQILPMVAAKYIYVQLVKLYVYGRFNNLVLG